MTVRSSSALRRLHAHTMAAGERLLPVLSVLLVALAVWITLSIAPEGRERAMRDAVAYTADSDIGNWRGRDAPLFAFDGNLFPEQCGKTWVVDAETVLIDLYDDTDCPATPEAAGSLRLYRASPRLLWAMIPESERETLGARSRSIVDSLGTSLAGTLRTAYFEREYRSEMTEILRTALRRAWSSPTVKDALSNAMRSVDPEIVDRLVDGILPVAVEKAQSTFWETVRGFTGSLFGQDGRMGDASPMARALRAIFEDERVQNHLLRTLPELASDPEVSILATRFAGELGLALINDPRVAVLMTTLLTDPQMIRPDAGSGIGGRFLTQEIPRWLLRYRFPNDHNPMVAYVVRSLLRGDGAFVTLLLTPDQAARLDAQGLRGGVGITGVSR
ncbi:MAG: hypothetical protein AB7G39_09080 [Alphaproteobacteria bacterium]